MPRMASYEDGPPTSIPGVFEKAAFKSGDAHAYVVWYDKRGVYVRQYEEQGYLIGEQPWYPAYRLTGRAHGYVVFEIARVYAREVMAGTTRGIAGAIVSDGGEVLELEEPSHTTLEDALRLEAAAKKYVPAMVKRLDELIAGTYELTPRSSPRRRSM